MEITAPAGNFEKLRYAFAYKADAVYLAAQQYGLRASADNFTIDEIKSAVDYAHAIGKKVFLTINIFSLNSDIAALPTFLQEIKDFALDAVIVSEPGTLSLVKKYTGFRLHLSTQANTTNYEAVRFWKDYGIDRVILAREVSYREMLEIREKNPEIEVEAFIHGAMCIAWSGRCLMSAALNNRSANQGECTHPCRWVWNLAEPKRPGQEFSVEGDATGSYVMHSKDLCLLKELPLLATAGISAGKIEGRMKSTYYTALMSRTYQEAQTLRSDNLHDWQALAAEVNKNSHRPYYSGFFYARDEMDYTSMLPQIDVAGNYQNWQYCGKVDVIKDGFAWFDSLVKIETGDTVQIIFPDRRDDVTLKVGEIVDEDTNFTDATKPNRRYALPVNLAAKDWGLIRKLELDNE